MKFTIGDVVTLKSGSPRLTVTKIINEAVTCACFRDGEVKTFEFPMEALEPLCLPGLASSSLAARLFGFNLKKTGALSIRRTA